MEANSRDMLLLHFNFTDSAWTSVGLQHAVSSKLYKTRSNVVITIKHRQKQSSSHGVEIVNYSIEPQASNEYLSPILALCCKKISLSYHCYTYVAFIVPIDINGNLTNVILGPKRPIKHLYYKIWVLIENCYSPFF
jgi:hypothetical protein